nr:protein rep [Xenorhabdus aichiensis]
MELWRDCLRIDYDPNIDVLVVKSKSPRSEESLVSSTAELIRGVVSETLKYSTKPSDMVVDPEWFLELTRQTFKRRFIATGGALKDVLKLDQETNEDLILAYDMADGSDDGSRLTFGKEIGDRRYRRLPEKDGKKRGT